MPHTTTAPEAMTNRSLRAYLYGLPGVDEVGAAARAKDLSTRSVKTTAKATAIDLAISMVDLTTLEGADTPGKVRALCTKAAHPDPADRTVPTVGAVCVYPDMVANAVTALRGTGVGVASVATAFPSGRAPLEAKLVDTRHAVAEGATEIDMVIDRGAFLAGDYLKVFEEITAVKEACGGAHLKVILETGELVTYDNVRRASHLAIRAGADFIKTSTGFASGGATVEDVALFREHISPDVRIKAAGGIRTFEQAQAMLEAGADRIGASALVALYRQEG